MKKICLVDSTYPINTRTNKIYQSLVKEYGYGFVYVIAWNRDGRNSEDKENYFIFNKKAAYGAKFHKFINLLSFQKFIRKIFFNTKFDIVIASHWETLFLVSKLKTKDMVLIYENLDIPTAGNKCVLKTLQYIEEMALRKTDAIVFASRFFVPLYNFYKKEKVILENKPDGKFLPQQDKEHEGFNVIFLGVIRYFDILKNLIDAVKYCDGVNCILYGDGPDFEKVKKYSNGLNNVFIKGRYESNQLSDIYAEADIIWAVYPDKDYNVRFAISNKFHESINFAKPCIFAKNTELGKYVMEKEIGFTVNPYSSLQIKEALVNAKNDGQYLAKVRENLIELSKINSTWDCDFSKVLKYLNTL